MNKVQLLGRLTRDPELKRTNSGKDYCRFTVAVDRRKKQGEERQADFINCTAWNRTAEIVAQWFSKGKPIAVTGSIRTDKYEKDGQTRYTTEVWADEVEFIPGSKTDGAQQNYGRPPQEAGPYPPGYAPPPASGRGTAPDGGDWPASGGDDWEEITGAELPF